MLETFADHLTRVRAAIAGLQGAVDERQVLEPFVLYFFRALIAAVLEGVDEPTRFTAINSLILAVKAGGIEYKGFSHCGFLSALPVQGTKVTARDLNMIGELKTDLALSFSHACKQQLSQTIGQIDGSCGGVVVAEREEARVWGVSH